MFDDLRERAAAEYEETATEEPVEKPSALAGMLESVTPQQRFILSLMLFLNVTVLGCLCLIATGRIHF